MAHLGRGSNQHHQQDNWNEDARSASRAEKLRTKRQNRHGGRYTCKALRNLYNTDLAPYVNTLLEEGALSA